MLVLDAGALIALGRETRDVVALLKGELRDGREPKTHGAVLGQVWRGGGGRQAPLARALRGVEILPVDAELGRRAGMLLKAARSSDVVDAALVAIADDGDELLTSDVEDLEALAVAAGLELDLVRV